MTSRIFIGIIIALIAVIALLGFDRWHLQKNVKDLQVNIGKYETLIAVLNKDINEKDTLIDLQNKAVDSLKTQADERAKKANELIARAKKETEVNIKKANELLLTKRETENACKDAENLINKYLGLQ